MLYIFENKIYVKPFDSKVVEVSVNKKDNEYNVKAIGKPVELNSMQLRSLIEIDLEEAYKHQNKGNKILNEKKSERKKDLF